VRWSRVAQHFAVSLTKTSRFGALLTLGDQMSTRCDPTVDARSRVRLLEESVLMPQCCDRNGGMHGGPPAAGGGLAASSVHHGQMVLWGRVALPLNVFPAGISAATTSGTGREPNHGIRGGGGCSHL
jgi:hypothetical protein